MSDVQIIKGGTLSPLITDDFILVPRPKKHDGKSPLVVKFTAKEVR